MDTRSFIRGFQRHLKEENKSESTIAAYCKDMEQFADFIGDKNVRDVNKKDIGNFVKYVLKEKKLTKKTASRKINSIKTYYRYLIEKNKVFKNPADEINHPEIEKNPPRILSPVEYKAIRETARRNFRNYTIIELLLQTGIKISEVSNLKIEDVKLDSLPPKLLINENGKNPMRFINLNKQAAEVLTKYLKTRVNYPDDRGYLFNTRSGREILPRNIRTGVDRICKRAGVENVCVNDFRNTFIIHQLENGVRLKTIAESVGHRRPSTTEAYLKYTKRQTPGTAVDIFPL